jgi:AcrR family transcriptional regulator
MPMPHSTRPATLRRMPEQDGAAETIHRILDAAKDAWLAKQDAPPQIDELAWRSDLPASAIHRHFPSADAIRDALFRRYVARRAAEYRDMLETLPEDANAQEVCATTVMATLRAGSAQPLGPVQRFVRAEFLAYAQRHGRPLLRAMAAELFAFLQRRQLVKQGETTAERVLATGMAMRDSIAQLMVENPALLAEARTAGELTEWLHQALFQLAPAPAPTTKPHTNGTRL